MAKQNNESKKCPVCESSQTRLFFSQLNVPTQVGYLAPSRIEALDCTLGDILLHHCSDCAHIWNSSFDPDKLKFDGQYDFSQYHSAAYRDYISASLERLKTRYGLVGKTALDIGCGKGDYLRLLVASGIKEAIGFDPTFVDADFSEEERARITVYRKYYGTQSSALKPDLLTCRSVLQYIPAPRPFLSLIRETESRNLDAVVYFEVVNGQEPFREKIIWQVMYEAGCFFSPSSIARLFRECGFQVLDILPALGSSQLELEAKPSLAPTKHEAESPDQIAQVSKQVDGFQAEYDSQVRKWTERFDEYQHKGKRVVLWAAGMRAISLLGNVPVAAAIVDYVVDVNPHRQGRFLPKTGQQVIAPEDLSRIRPDVVIATNPNYAAEILAQIGAMGIHCDFDILH